MSDQIVRQAEDGGTIAARVAADRLEARTDISESQKTLALVLSQRFAVVIAEAASKQRIYSDEDFAVAMSLAIEMTAEQWATFLCFAKENGL